MPVRLYYGETTDSQDMSMVVRGSSPEPSGKLIKYDETTDSHDMTTMVRGSSPEPSDKIRRDYG